MIKQCLKCGEINGHRPGCPGDVPILLTNIDGYIKMETSEIDRYIKVSTSYIKW